jgi:RimJ/RimL family protein N-acetyltransferase
VTFERQPVLSGTLVDLRPLEVADFPALYDIASDPAVWEQHPSKDRAQRSVFGRWFDEAIASGGALAVVSQNENRVIGTSRFDHYDPVQSEVEIGWTFVARTHWGGEYNGEIKRLMLRHASQFVQNVLFIIGASGVSVGAPGPD